MLDALSVCAQCDFDVRQRVRAHERPCHSLINQTVAVRNCSHFIALKRYKTILRNIEYVLSFAAFCKHLFFIFIIFIIFILYIRKKINRIFFLMRKKVKHFLVRNLQSMINRICFVRVLLYMHAVFWKRSILRPLPPLPLPRFLFRFHQNEIILLVAIPPTYLEAAGTANRFRFRFQNTACMIGFFSTSVCLTVRAC